ncbi:MAG TPA: hypothetical protein PLQ87_09705, partial [Phycisphaerae bacterium]|nr:hypothetical protein [Phycisphaerae bacterium]
MRTIIGALFVALVMMPGAIYMGLVAGQSLGSAAEWVTIILFAELARRSFTRGNSEMALDLVDKAIDARPTFWESYQLRSLIYLSAMQFGQA